MRSPIPFLLSVILLILIPFYAQAEETDFSHIEKLEELASRQMEAGNYEPAYEIYLNLENELQNSHLDILNEQLLMNEAIAAYLSHKPGAAVAHLQQLYIVNHSKEAWQMYEELQALIEHRIYQKAPNTEFVRGESTDYSTWSLTHHYSDTVAKIHFLAVWFLLFIVLSTFFIFQRGTRMHRSISWLSGICLVLVLASGLLVLKRHQTDELRFGVLLDNSKVHSEPFFESPLLPDKGFIPGMTVSLVSFVPGWIKISRVDGVTGWVKSEECYLLRGRNDQHSWRIE